MEHGVSMAWPGGANVRLRAGVAVVLTGAKNE